MDISMHFFLFLTKGSELYISKLNTFKYSATETCSPNYTFFPVLRNVRKYISKKDVLIQLRL